MQAVVSNLPGKGDDMQLDFNSDKPIFLQIAEGVEDAILSGAFPPETQIPSITEFSVAYKINPATALKGINLLVDQNVLYKKRGVGMFVAENARSVLKQKRQKDFYDSYVVGLVEEAGRLDIAPTEVEALVKQAFERRENHD